MVAATEANHFDIAKEISEKLIGLSKDKQERILRWVAEGIGLNAQSLLSLGEASNPGISTPSIGAAQAPPGSRSDIKSFVASKFPKSDQQFAAVVAYYYRFEAPPTNRKNFITGEVLQEAARLAGRKRFGRPLTTLNNAKSAGYLDSGSPGEFIINSVGENLVAMTLPSGTDIESRKMQKSKKLRKNKGKKRVR